MGNLRWTYATVEGTYFMIADGENGMRAVIWADTEFFAFPGVFVEYNGLRKIPEAIMVDQKSAVAWCEKEIAQWQPVPKR